MNEWEKKKESTSTRINACFSKLVHTETDYEH